MTILVALINGGSYELGAEHDTERLRWEIGKQGQLAIIRQNNNHMGLWEDDIVVRVFSARHWAEVEVVD